MTATLEKRKVKNPEFYRQCLLQKEKKRMVAWIPSEIADVGNVVNLEDNKNNKETEWTVLFSGTKVPSRYVQTSQGAHKSHRTRTDV